VAAIVVLAISAFTLLAYLDPKWHPAEVTAAVSFGAFALVVYALPYALASGAGAAASPAFLAHLSSVLLAPTWSSVAIVALGSALGELVSRRVPLKATFNVAQYTFSVTASIFAYRLSGGVGFLSGGEPALAPILVAWAAFTVVNSSAVASVVSASTERPFLDVWRENSLNGFVFDVIALPFVVGFAVVYMKFGVVPTIAMLALLLILRQLSSANEALHSSNRELLELTVTTLEARDPYTSGHSRRVAQYSRMVGQALNLPQKQMERLSVAALLHDVGKIHEVFAPILSKPGRLTPEERAVMETHPIKGAELVKISSQLRDAVEPIRHHHEAWDGSGYPDGKKGEEIPLFARIIAIADTVDAMASDRPYRRGMPAEKIRDEMIRMRGVQFDPSIIDQLVKSGALDSILRIAASAPVGQPSSEARLSLVSIG
jgi:hypothetical protein